MQKKQILGMTKDELRLELQQIQESNFRADQIFDWLHFKKIKSFDEMTNISKKTRAYLSQNYSLSIMQVIKVNKSKDNTSQKFLLKCEDDELVEVVLLSYKHGDSICISSQIGCNMGCKFCASTIGGKLRNLSSAEMLSQIYTISSLLDSKISHVVVMGMGEPLDNFDNLIKFVIILTDEKGYNMSKRNITVSTCGLVPKIYELADNDLGITLALSLHSAFDDKRKTIMPIANKYSIKEIIKACEYYFLKTGRRITFEYSLIKGFNDGIDDANELARLTKQTSAHVNLIPVNRIENGVYEAPDKKSIDYFKLMLEKRKVNSTIRRSMGQDIDGACGQLRKRHLTNY